MTTENRKIQNFTDLNVWKDAHALALRVYISTRQFPKEELYGLTSQIRRAAISVPSNIAEGFGRRSQHEKRNFYNIAAGSLTEVQSQLLLARDLQMLSGNEFEELFLKSVSIHKMLNALLSYFS